jgi:hypothetical protein
MTNTSTRCTGRNGTYVCELDAGHYGEHRTTYHDRINGGERRAKWFSPYGEMRFTKPANGATRFPRPSAARKGGAGTR